MILYKFLSSDRIDVLKNQMIRFSQTGTFNDVFEANPNFLTDGNAINPIGAEIYFIATEELLLPESYNNIIEHVKLSFDRNKHYRMLSVQIVEKHMINQYLLEGFRKELAKGHNDNLLILSLTESWDNELMWAHYAQHYRGYCIGFDSEHTMFNVESSGDKLLNNLYKVEYSKSRPKDYVESLSFNEKYLVKSEKWSYENEWRMIRQRGGESKLNVADPYDIFLFDAPHTAIKEIIIGANATQELVDQIFAVIRSNDLKIDVFKLSILDGNGYSFERILLNNVDL